MIEIHKAILLDVCESLKQAVLPIKLICDLDTDDGFVKVKIAEEFDDKWQKNTSVAFWIERQEFVIAGPGVWHTKILLCYPDYKERIVKELKDEIQSDVSRGNEKLKSMFTHQYFMNMLRK